MDPEPFAGPTPHDAVVSARPGFPASFAPSVPRGAKLAARPRAWLPACVARSDEAHRCTFSDLAR